MTNLQFTNNQVYDGNLAALTDYDAVKYDRIKRTLSFYLGASPKVVFQNVDNVDWRSFEDHFKTTRFFEHRTQWAWFKDSAIISREKIHPHLQVKVNFDAEIYSLNS